MTDLSKEQSAALVAALENGGRFSEKGPYQPVIDAGLAEWRVGNGKDVDWGDNHFALTPAGRIVAQLCKELDIAIKDRDAYAEESVSLRRVQKPYWRPIVECGELEAAEYWALNSEFGRGVMPVYPGGTSDDGQYTHILYLDPNPVTVPAAPESEGT